jgi:hypothetical protein
VRHAVAAGAMVLLLPLAAAAQSGGAAPVGQGPMTVEKVHGGFLVAPDFKITEVDRKTSGLAGGYAGWVTDGQFFIGGGGYWLANQSSDRKMAYGGLVVQWLARTDERFGFSAKALVGGGQATLSSTVSEILAQPDLRGMMFGRLDLDELRHQPVGSSMPIRFREDFFVAEPEVHLLVRLTEHVRLTGGAGYRFIGAEGRDNNRLSGAVGSVGLQVGGGS